MNLTIQPNYHLKTTGLKNNQNKNNSAYQPSFQQQITPFEHESIRNSKLTEALLGREKEIMFLKKELQEQANNFIKKLDNLYEELKENDINNRIKLEALNRELFKKDALLKKYAKIIKQQDEIIHGNKE